MEKHKWKNAQMRIASLIILMVAAILTVVLLNKNQGIAWGSDTYGHLYKANVLYDALREGNYFLDYDWNWYNGLQPFRYWAPMPYYLIAGLNFFVHNIEAANNLFMIFIFVVGGYGFVIWGQYLKRPFLGLILGILWFFVPNNIRVLFAEGNLPAVIVTTFLPYIFLYFYRCIKEEKRSDFIWLALFMAIITLNHAMLTAMTGITLFVYGVLYSVSNKSYKQVFRALVCAALGIFTVGIWLIPALEGGIFELTSQAAVEVMKGLSFPLTTSLNPFLRAGEPDIYYFGLGFAIVILFGCLFTYKKHKSPYIAAGLILLGTTTVALPVLSSLPFGQLLWMKRFTSMAMCLVFVGILTWKSLRKSLLWLVILIMIVDSGTNYKLLGFKIPVNDELVQTMDQAIDVAAQRVALLDLSVSDSYPSYYLAYGHADKKVGQVFGWAWQGAATAENIVTLNTALEEGYYGLMLDRALELGADTLIIPEEFIKDPLELEKWANVVGYDLISSQDNYRVYKYPVTGSFGTKVKYEGLLVGEKASNLEYLFPSFINGESEYIDDYSIEELSQYKAIFLSGFKYHSKEDAQHLLTKVARGGTRVVMDTVGQTTSLFDLVLQPISIKEKFNHVYYNGEALTFLPFPKGLKDFRTNFIAQEIKGESENYAIVENQRLNYIYEHEPNIYTLALNLPYYAYLTKDEKATLILEDLLGMEAYTLPNREVAPIQVDRTTDKEIVVRAEQEGVTLPIAYLDTFDARSGSITQQNHLLKLEGAKAQVDITSPYGISGWGVSIISLISLAVLILNVNRNKRVTGQVQMKEGEEVGL